VDIEHLGFSLFGSGKRESHEQDGETLSRAHHAQSRQRPAILPMAFMVFHRLANGHSVRALGGTIPPRNGEPSARLQTRAEKPAREND
jgi:hypothetical protein